MLDMPFQDCMYNSNICKITKREKIPFSLLLTVHLVTTILLRHKYNYRNVCRCKNFKPNFPNVCIMPWHAGAIACDAYYVISFMKLCKFKCLRDVLAAAGRKNPHFNVRPNNLAWSRRSSCGDVCESTFTLHRWCRLSSIHPYPSNFVQPWL